MTGTLVHDKKVRECQEEFNLLMLDLQQIHDPNQSSLYWQDMLLGQANMLIQFPTYPSLSYLT